jgi:NAD(P)-dependent dehydrogenase (short-subunit alcohol dehydrogenase family)
MGLTADVAEPKDIARVFAEVDEQFEHLDNAGLSAEDILEGDYSHWDYIIRTNLTGYFACAHEAFQRMRTTKVGHIVNVVLSAKLTVNGAQRCVRRPTRY